MDKALKEILEQTEKKLKQGLNRTFLKKLAADIANGIKTRTRLGKGVQFDGGKQEKLKPLKKSYIEQRGKDKKKGDLSPNTGVANSNLTRTGQLLDSIVSAIRGNNIIKISFRERRDDGKKNIKIVDYQEDQNRPFFYLSKPEQRNIERIVRQQLRKELGKNR